MPWFIVGFLALAVVRSFGLIPQPVLIIDRGERVVMSSVSGVHVMLEKRYLKRA